MKAPRLLIRRAGFISPSLIAGLLVVGLAVHAYLLYDDYLAADKQATGTISAPDSPAQRSPSDIDYAAQISGVNLLGEPRAEAATPVVTQAPVTDLDLTLQGVLAGMEPNMAIIGDRGKQQVYAEGEELPGGVVLHSVQENKVILRRAGRHETLPMSEPELLIVPVEDAPELMLNQEEDLSSMLTGHLEVIPVYEDDRLVGYRIGPRNRETLAAELGIPPEEMMSEVMELPLEEGDDMDALLEVLAETDPEVAAMLAREGFGR